MRIISYYYNNFFLYSLTFNYSVNESYKKTFVILKEKIKLQKKNIIKIYKLNLHLRDVLLFTLIKQ